MRGAFLFLFVSGCSLVPYVSPQEKCAARGMVLSGVAASEGYSTGFAYVNGKPVVVGSDSFTETAICREIRSTDDLCVQAALRASAVIKSGYNLRARKVAVLLGYTLLILPGILIQVALHENAKKAERQAEEKFNEVLSRCRGEGQAVIYPE